MIKDGQNLIDIISKKISGKKKDIEKIEKKPTLPEVSEKDQDVIKEFINIISLMFLRCLVFAITFIACHLTRIFQSGGNS